ncbi:MAG: hypothetical protein JW384_02577 [Nitrosomonadaceae bacterium]|nr:hypothetical protein [Nitrosomonadaceae bacterium]
MDLSEETQHLKMLYKVWLVATSQKKYRRLLLVLWKPPLLALVHEQDREQLYKSLALRI